MENIIDNTKGYLAYLRNHYFLVQNAWSIVQEKCKKLRFVSNDFIRRFLNMEIKNHDLSKLSKEEFIPYRIYFFPTEKERKLHNLMGINKSEFKKASERHFLLNPHHWQNWTKSKKNKIPYEDEINCVHMIVDWMAMEHLLGNSARHYYENNKDNIDLPKWAISFIYEIFDLVYEKELENEKV